ncbi:4'-phosphopantetheinyl transferase superfamily protein [Streptomyces sp. NPDC005925]|uniref:4'-phosphopantetheinyl transferase family protein n=1 Tax=Streptomyces sp. NPDC005925 TaxID=3157172 RepID=UPI0033DB8D06
MTHGGSDAAPDVPAHDAVGCVCGVGGGGPSPVTGLAAHVPDGAGGIHAWWADGRGLTAEVVAELAATTLPPHERRRYDAVSDPLGRTEFVLARWVLRGALGRVLGLPPDRVPLAVDGAGRPWTAGEPDVDVNVAHTAGLVAVAVGTGLAPGTRVGVDIEAIRPVPRADVLARRLFSPAERALLDAARGPAEDAAWLDIWTRREAYVKALGTGVLTLADAPEQGVGHAWHPLRLPCGFTGGLVVVPPAGRAGPPPFPHPFPLSSDAQGALP